MDIMADNARMPIRSKEAEVEGRGDQLNVQMVAEMAAQAHRSEDAEEDVLHDLRDTFSRTPSVSGRPSVRRNNSGKIGATRGRPKPPQRAQSMNLPRAPQPSRSTDLSTMPTLLAGAGSSRSMLQRPGVSRTNSHSKTFRRAMPTRTASDSLRNMRKDKLVNTALERKESTHSLMRASSDDKSVVTISDLESCFTMDSVNIRKNQMIADPLDAGTYHETDSCANHDDSISHWSEHMPTVAQDGNVGGGGGGHESVATFCTLDSLRLQRLQIHDVLDQACDISFFSQSFSTLNTADIDLDSIMDDDGLFELNELNESELCDLADSDLISDLVDHQPNGACVSVEDADNVD